MEQTHENNVAKLQAKLVFIRQSPVKGPKAVRILEKVADHLLWFLSKTSFLAQYTEVGLVYLACVNEIANKIPSQVYSKFIESVSIRYVQFLNLTNVNLEFHNEILLSWLLFWSQIEDKTLITVINKHSDKFSNFADILFNLGNFYSQRMATLVCADCIRCSANKKEMIETLIPGERFQRARDSIACIDDQDEVSVRNFLTVFNSCCEEWSVFSIALDYGKLDDLDMCSKTVATKTQWIDFNVRRKTISFYLDLSEKRVELPLLELEIKQIKSIACEGFVNSLEVKLVLKNALGLVFENNDNLQVSKITFGFSKIAESSKILVNDILPKIFKTQTQRYEEMMGEPSAVTTNKKIASTDTAAGGSCEIQNIENENEENMTASISETEESAQNSDTSKQSQSDPDPLIVSGDSANDSVSSVVSPHTVETSRTEEINPAFEVMSVDEDPEPQPVASAASNSNECKDLESENAIEMTENTETPAGRLPTPTCVQTDKPQIDDQEVPTDSTSLPQPDGTKLLNTRRHSSNIETSPVNSTKNRRLSEPFLKKSVLAPLPTPENGKPTAESNDYLEGSALQATIDCYLTHNGLTCPKEADGQLRENFQKIKKMIDRSTTKFFAKQPTAEPVEKENTYDVDAEFGPRKSERQNLLKKSVKQPTVTAKEIPHHDYLAPKFTAEPLKRVNYSYRRKPLANQSNLIDSGKVKKQTVRRSQRKNAALKPIRATKIVADNKKPIENKETQSTSKHQPKVSRSRDSSRSRKSVRIKQLYQNFSYHFNDKSSDDESADFFLPKNKTPPIDAQIKAADVVPPNETNDEPLVDEPGIVPQIQQIENYLENLPKPAMQNQRNKSTRVLKTPRKFDDYVSSESMVVPYPHKMKPKPTPEVPDNVSRTSRKRKTPVRYLNSIGKIRRPTTKSKSKSLKSYLRTHADSMPKLQKQWSPSEDPSKDSELRSSRARRLSYSDLSDDHDFDNDNDNCSSVASTGEPMIHEWLHNLNTVGPLTKERLAEHDANGGYEPSSSINSLSLRCWGISDCEEDDDCKIVEQLIVRKRRSETFETTVATKNFEHVEIAKRIKTSTPKVVTNTSNEVPIAHPKTVDHLQSFRNDMIAGCKEQFAQFWSQLAAENAYIFEQFAMQTTEIFNQISNNYAMVKASEEAVTELRQKIQVELEKMRMLNDANKNALHGHFQVMKEADEGQQRLHADAGEGFCEMMQRMLDMSVEMYKREWKKMKKQLMDKVNDFAETIN